MTSILERYKQQIAGTISCFDRIIISATIPGICYPEGMARHITSKGIRLFDYPHYVEPLREEIRANTEKIAKETGLEIEHIQSKKTFRKEDRIKEILKQRGTHEGIIYIFSAMEPCPAYTPWHDKPSGKTTLRYKDGKCLHYYIYFIDQTYGLCYLRVPTWAPFRLQFYCNGHNYLANKLSEQKTGYKQLDNTFISFDNWNQAQSVADGFSAGVLHVALDLWAQKLCPILHHFGDVKHHWSIMQCELSLDVVFFRQKDLAPLYDSMVRTAVHAVKCDNIATFLGKKLDGRFKDEVGNDFHTRIMGTRLKHHMGPVAIKMYDKFGLVLRVETVVNDVKFFRHYREVEHKDGSVEKKFACMQKSIYSLGALRECMCASNRRYLEFMSELVVLGVGVLDVERLSSSVRVGGRCVSGFNLFCKSDLDVIVGLVRGEGVVGGVTNKLLRGVLAGRSSAWVSRVLRRLRLHGLIKKVGGCFRYYLTGLGRRVLLAGLKLRELVVIPSLSGVLS